MADVPTLVAVNRVLPGRGDEFERWLTEVLSPAARGTGVADGSYRVLRSADEDGPFLFLFYGGSAESWDIEPMLEQAYGADRAATELQVFSDLLDGDQDFHAYTEVQV